eukprot:TRINITY_DN9970_c0_g1_i3.p1 TRINITY_DN9970_c0_g1~~TRINITY_DN9970_c0_g1_i3.p1  ORF type:complete len:332 (+),score=49.32 TRINITY_DN9970_c0_g1_i3:65-1060(+)
MCIRDSYPTEKEFANFEEFVQKVDSDNSLESGIIKVVPPAGWKARQASYDQDVQTTMVKGPIEQNAYGKGGIYELLYIQKKSMLAKEYRNRTISMDKFAEGKTVEEIEDIFWKNVTFSPPLYGADMVGSLFEDGVDWNLRELNTILDHGIDSKLPGVNVPYIYVGSWKTMFGWHTEDFDLPSINYLHLGKPKFWYSIHPKDSAILEEYAKKNFLEGFSKCSEYLRHKTILINPYLLKQKYPHITMHKMVQNPGEFIITLPGAYHSGFNWGFNLAESVNFGSLRWLEVLNYAKACKCMSDSVRINKQELYRKLVKTKYNDCLLYTSPSPRDS